VRASDNLKLLSIKKEAARSMTGLSTKVNANELRKDMDARAAASACR